MGKIKNWSVEQEDRQVKTWRHASGENTIILVWDEETGRWLVIDDLANRVVAEGNKQEATRAANQYMRRNP